MCKFTVSFFFNTIHLRAGMVGSRILISAIRAITRRRCAIATTVWSAAVTRIKGVLATVSRSLFVLVALVVATSAARADEVALVARRQFKPVVESSDAAQDEHATEDSARDLQAPRAEHDDVLPSPRRPAPHVLDFGIGDLPAEPPADEVADPPAEEPAAELAEPPSDLPSNDEIESALSPSEFATPSTEDIAAGDRIAPVAPGCSVWYVSTRNLPLEGDPAAQAAQMDFECYAAGEGWVPSTLAAFLATDDPNTRTTFYVHGNWATEDDAHFTGNRMRELLTDGACGSWRFVIFTWPADRCGKSMVRDARMKAARAEAQSYYLAWLLDQLDPRVPVTLVGYSYGTRLISSGLHLLGGGAVHHRRLEPRVHPERCGIRAILIAAAIDANCFGVDGRYSAALFSVDCVLATVNARDPYLCFYSLLYGAGGPPALGYSGVLEAAKLKSRSQLVSQMDVTRSVRRHHVLNSYVEAPQVLAELRHFAQADVIRPAEPSEVGPEVSFANPAREIDSSVHDAKRSRSRRLLSVGHSSRR